MANKSIVAQKEEKVKALSEEIKGANLVLIVDYRGTTVEDDTKLRKDIRENNGKAKVVKNNILKRALDANGESALDNLLEGPNALIVAKEDYLAPLKVAYKFSTTHENYKIKGGFVEGKLMSVDEIITLAKLPSREELLSKLAGSLLQTIAKVAVAIDQVRIKKEEEEKSGEANHVETASENKADETSKTDSVAKVENAVEETANNEKKSE